MNHQISTCENTWDLTLLFSTKEECHNLSKKTLQEAQEFQKKYQEKIGQLPPQEFLIALKEYESLYDAIYRTSAYAFLNYTTQLNDHPSVAFYRSIQEISSNIESFLVFFITEISSSSILNNIEDFVAQSPLKHYTPLLRDIADQKKHILSREIEEVLVKKSISGKQAWCSLFDEDLAKRSFIIDGQNKSLAEAIQFLMHPDRSQREKAYKVIADVLSDRIELATFIYNTLIKDHGVEAQIRNYPSPESVRHMSNFIEDEVVNSLENTVKKSYKNTIHRYYRLKAQWLGLEKLMPWDRLAPPPSAPSRTIPWEEAKQIVLEAFNSFSSEFCSIAEKFFTERRIDIFPKQGKESGAFSHPVSAQASPYILLNYQGKHRDVTTLAHELGHGIHQTLSAQQGSLMSGAPLILAETASIFAELLTFDMLLKKVQSEEEKAFLLSSKIEDILGSVMRQTAFYTFEKKAHSQASERLLSSQDFGRIWHEVSQEHLGDYVHLDQNYEVFWSYITHFIHTPFYVYAYAFGELFTHTLFTVYKENPQEFFVQYQHLLESGGTLRHHEASALFNLNTREPLFWEKGMQCLTTMIDTFENSLKNIKKI